MANIKTNLAISQSKSQIWEKSFGKGRVLLDPGWVSKYENSLNLNLIVPDGL